MNNLQVKLMGKGYQVTWEIGTEHFHFETHNDPNRPMEQGSVLTIKDITKTSLPIAQFKGAYIETYVPGILKTMKKVIEEADNPYSVIQ